MTSALSKHLIQNFKLKSPLRDLSMFLNKDGPVWLTIRSLAKHLKDEKVSYAVVGGLAVYAHGYERTTRDCDILLSKAGYEKFQNRLVNLGLKPKFPGARKKFICISTGTLIYVIVEGEYPGNGSVGPIRFPDPATCQQHIDNMNVISLPKLIELKLASYQCFRINRAKDLADVIELIKSQNLNRSFADLLDPSIRNEFEQLILGLEEDNRKRPIDDE